MPSHDRPGLPRHLRQFIFADMPFYYVGMRSEFSFSAFSAYLSLRTILALQRTQSVAPMNHAAGGGEGGTSMKSTPKSSPIVSSLGHPAAYSCTPLLGGCFPPFYLHLYARPCLISLRKYVSALAG